MRSSDSSLQRRSLMQRILTSKAVQPGTVRIGVKGQALPGNAEQLDEALSAMSNDDFRQIIFDFRVTTKRVGPERNRALVDEAKNAAKRDAGKSVRRTSTHYAILDELAVRLEPHQARIWTSLPSECEKYVRGERTAAPLAPLPSPQTDRKSVV